MKELIKLKIGRKVFTVTTKSVFADNGSCVQLITDELDMWGDNKWQVLTNKALKEIAPFRSATVKSEYSNCTCFVLLEEMPCA